MSTTGYNWLNAGGNRIKVLKPTTLCILTCLVRFHRDGVGCIVSQIRVARFANVSGATVNTHLDILERHGLIARERGGLNGRSKPSATRYHLPFEDSFEPMSRSTAATNNLATASNVTGPLFALPSVQNLETVIKANINTTYTLGSLTAPLIQHCLAVCGPGLCHQSRKEIRDSDHIVIEWLAAGYSFEHDILPVLRRKTARSRRRPILTWSYFTEAIAESHFRRQEREKQTRGGAENQ